MRVLGNGRGKPFFVGAVLAGASAPSPTTHMTLLFDILLLQSRYALLCGT